MEPAILAFTATLFSAHVAAQSLNNYPQSGTTGITPNEGYDTFMKAAQSSNASNSVQFAHYNAILGQGQDETILRNWTWTVKVSDVHMPNVSTIQSLTNVAYTIYDFSWPE